MGPLVKVGERYVYGLAGGYVLFFHHCLAVEPYGEFAGSGAGDGYVAVVSAGRGEVPCELRCCGSAGHRGVGVNPQRGYLLVVGETLDEGGAKVHRVERIEGAASGGDSRPEQGIALRVPGHGLRVGGHVYTGKAHERGAAGLAV